jgi:hypothetical protein
MSFYNMLFGMNGKADLLLAVIGLKQCDIERFRDCHVSEDGATISVYTRTGGGNREGYPNLLMRKRPEWSGSTDDDYDRTYCTDTFTVPEQWRADVAGLSDILANGLRKEFAQHLAATLQREPNERDIATAAYLKEEAALKRTRHFMANGHTFVPQDDYAAQVALDLAEANEGRLRSCWGIAPLVITVEQNKRPYPKSPDPSLRQHMVRVEVGYNWQIDEDYWQHMRERWEKSHPLTMAQIAETVERRRKATA